jgi:hypothetical protein
MGRVTSQIRNFAKRLIEYETQGNKSTPGKALAAFEICEKLRPPLAALMGNGGFRAILGRALALAIEEVPGLHTLSVKPDGVLEGVQELHAQLDANKFFEGGVVLLAQLLGLLVAFIGESLTLRLVREVWPRLSLPDDFEFGKGDKNEKTK